MFSLFRAGYHSLRSALSKTRSFLSQGLKRLFGGPLDADAQETLERLLYESDFGVAAASRITEGVARRLRSIPQPSGAELVEALTEEIRPLLPPMGQPLQRATTGPTVVLIVGVNGNGKTTTLAKLAHLYQSQGLKVMLAAADTFRAAAVDQLQIWADRLGCDCIRGATGGDPAAVAFDACKAAGARGADLLFIDTAGRLQNKDDLMRELQKIRRVCDKALPGAPHETFLVVEATTGQNALDQAKAFQEHTPLSGLIITKLDGTARGGMAVALYQSAQLPVRWVGTGEQIGDLDTFDPELYLQGLLEGAWQEANQ
jgi:fused signal recognition particle receptor